MADDLDLPPPPDSGLFGLDCDRDEAQVVVVPVPYEATVSYRTGTASGPEAVRQASHQLDLCDADAGDLSQVKVHTASPEARIAELNAQARPAAERVIAALEQRSEPGEADLTAVNEAGDDVCIWLEKEVGALLDADRFPAVLGGDHSVALGGLLAARSRHPELGVLQFDAHADLRAAYEGFVHSHASVMRNLVEQSLDAPLVQVGIRDFSQDELEFIRTHDNIDTFFDRSLRHARLNGTFFEMVHDIVDCLPQKVWVSFDIDGLDPALCPQTGTPVPGGLSFDEAIAILEAVVDSGRTIVGADLCEVSPGAELSDDDSWDAVVGARVLYKLIGYGMMSQGKLERPQLPAT